MKNKQPIQTVQRVRCPKCGELQIKIYPWSSFKMQGSEVPACVKCLNKVR